MPIGPTQNDVPPPHVAAYRAGRELAEAGKPLPADASPETRVGWYVLQPNAPQFTHDIELAFGGIAREHRGCLSAACQAAVTNHAENPRDRAVVALVGVLAALNPTTPSLRRK